MMDKFRMGPMHFDTPFSTRNEARPSPTYHCRSAITDTLGGMP